MIKSALPKIITCITASTFSLFAVTSHTWLSDFHGQRQVGFHSEQMTILIQALLVIDVCFAILTLGCCFILSNLEVSLMLM